MFKDFEDQEPVPPDVQGATRPVKNPVAAVLGGQPGPVGPQFRPAPAETHATRSAPRAQAQRSTAASERFRRTHFPEATRADWADWHWQLANRVTRPERLAEILNLSEDEQAALSWAKGALPFAVTPHYLSRIDPDDATHPLRKCMVPSTMEHMLGAGESEDPLHEEHDSPVPGLVHRYPDRVLFLATRFCAAYCRYCTRSRMVGGAAVPFERPRWEAALEYIERTPQVRDVLVSGGDPLTLEDGPLDWLLTRLRRIPHVEMIRLGTKVPMVLPQRVTPALTRMLKRHHPLFISVHCTHPLELGPESRQAFVRLADAGIPLGSQTVLLKGVNDDPATLKELFHQLLTVRVRPYYLYQCDPIQGSAHFRTTVERGIEIMSALRGHTSGYAVPTYVIDAPGGGGKIPIYPETMLGHDETGWRLRNYENREFRYPEVREDASCEPAAAAADAGKGVLQ
ncbi:MAG: KamA family radical SAM protein [Desulfovibrionaceae bacterium]|jgi:lysine 2,3-aminomutase|nr:KamA family radical SAM protein [Desulfovibrionaceae bacterium]